LLASLSANEKKQGFKAMGLEAVLAANPSLNGEGIKVGEVSRMRQLD
jgi:hypothetical protein